jgi:hypothetical protein
VANFYRLALALCLLAVSSFAVAVIQPVTRYQYGSFSGTAAEIVAQVQAAQPTRNCGVGVQPAANWYSKNANASTVEIWYSSSGCPGYGAYDAWQFTAGASGTSCPANSTASGASCVCNSGFSEINGQCKGKQSDACGDLKGQSLGLSQMEISVGVASTGALVGMVGKPGTSCFPGGCTVTGSVTGCLSGGAGGAVCFISSPSFTGAACEEKEPDKGCPAGTTPSAYAAGVCIPDKNDCPAGYSPSKYAAGVCIPDENPCPPGQSPSKYAQGVCLPNEDPNANGDKGEGKKNDCPKGYVPSKYVAGLCIPATTTTDKDGTTTCIGDVCTTTKPNGDKEEKPKDQFCAENPDSPLCVKGEFAGTCGAGFTCKGDAIQCAIGQEQHRRACKLFDDESPESALYNANKGKTGNQTGDLPGNETISLAGRIDSSDALAAGSAGVSDLNVTVWGQSITLPFSMINPYLVHLGNILLAVSFLLAVRIVARG